MPVLMAKIRPRPKRCGPGSMKLRTLPLISINLKALAHPQANSAPLIGHFKPVGAKALNRGSCSLLS
jgi:hypothetical protein